MKNLFNDIKEKVDSGFFVLAKRKDDTLPFKLFTGYDVSRCYPLLCFEGETREEALSMKESNINGYGELIYEMAIVEYFRPNDLFPSKRFKEGDKVEVKSSYIGTFVGQDDLEVKAFEQSIGGNLYRIYSPELKECQYIGEQYVYPRIEKQEELCSMFGKALKNGDVRISHFDSSLLSTGVTKCIECYEAVEKKPEDIIGEASKKALEDAGYTITKK